MPTLSAIRSAGEAELMKLIGEFDERHRAILRDAIRQYGRVQAIPESVWARIIDDEESNRLAAAIILLMADTDKETQAQMAAAGILIVGFATADSLAGMARSSARYATTAHNRVKDLIDSTRFTLHDRLARRIEDSRLSGPGDLGELTDEGIDAAIDDVFSETRSRGIATDETTAAISTGQIEARNRTVGDDGAALTVDGRRMTVALIWHTHPELSRTGPCPRCGPLNGQPEEVWFEVFPLGPGEDAHPNCVCELEIRIVPFVESDN